MKKLEDEVKEGEEDEEGMADVLGIPALGYGVAPSSIDIINISALASRWAKKIKEMTPADRAGVLAIIRYRSNTIYDKIVKIMEDA
jgi:hypothetical protein